MKTYLLVLQLALVMLATVSADAVAECNVLRVTMDSGDQVLLRSDVSNCLPQGAGNQAQAPAPEPTEEDNAAWVAFINDHCRATPTTLQEVEDTNRYYQCDIGDYSVLPAPAVKSFVQGLYFNGFNAKLSSLDGLDLVTNLPKLDIGYSNVTSLLPLSNVTSMNDLNASRSGLLNLDGLEGIASANTLYFDNTSVSNISGLSNLQSINTLRVNNTPLNSLAPLSSLTSANELNFTAAPLLSLEGLEGLTTIGKLNVSSGNITDFKGLDNLTSVTTDLDAGYNVNLVSLDGLENLTSVGGRLTIRNSRGLEDLRGLSNLASAGQVWFYDVFNNYTDFPEHRMAFDSSFCKGWRAKDIYVVNNNSVYNNFCTEDDSATPDSYWVRFVNDECDPVAPVGTVSDIESLALQCRHYNYAPKTFTSLPTQPELTAINSMYFNTPVNTLVGMSNVTTVTGTLYLQTIGLDSLEGLNSLVTANTLNFVNNNITSVQALESLTTVGVLDLSYNPLQSLDGLQVLSSATKVDLQGSISSSTIPLDNGSDFCVAARSGSIASVVLSSPYTIDDICVDEYVVAESGISEEQIAINQALLEEWRNFFVDNCFTLNTNMSGAFYHRTGEQPIDCSNRGITNAMMPDRWFSADDDMSYMFVDVNFYGNNLTHTDNFRGMYFLDNLDLRNNNITDISGLATIGYSLGFINLAENPISSAPQIGRLYADVLRNENGDEHPWNIEGRISLQNTPYCETEGNWYNDECNVLSRNPAIP